MAEGDDEPFVIDDTDPDEAAAELERRDADLNSVRIRQISSLRRGAFRARSWCIVAMVVCCVAAFELLRKTFQYVRFEHRWGLRPTGFVLFAVAALMIGWFFWKKIDVLSREMRTTLLETPVEPPDFTSLGDGSSRWKNLDDVQ